MIKRSLALVLIVLTSLSAKLFAQKPGISYQTPQTLYLEKAIQPIKVVNTGGAVPDKLYPYVTEVLKSKATVQRFVRLPSGHIYGTVFGSIWHIKPDGTSVLFAGGNNYGYVDATGTNARFNEIAGITSDKD